MSEKNESVEQKAEAQQETPKVIYIYKKHKNKKKKKTNPKPCHNGGYRMADLEKVMTPLELAQYNKKKEDLNKALTELNKLKTQANNLSEYTDRVFNRRAVSTMFVPILRESLHRPSSVLTISIPRNRSSRRKFFVALQPMSRPAKTLRRREATPSADTMLSCL